MTLKLIQQRINSPYPCDTGIIYSLEICYHSFFSSLTKGKIIYLNVSNGELNYLMRHNHIKIAVNGFLCNDMEVFHSLLLRK